MSSSSNSSNDKCTSSSILCKEVFDPDYQPSIEEINEYAVRIGINPEKEQYLLDLAKEGLLQAIPNDWQICYNDSAKAVYYHNKKTNETQWEHPLDNVYKALVNKARHRYQAGGDCSDDTSQIDSGIRSCLTTEESDQNSENPLFLKMTGLTRNNNVLLAPLDPPNPVPTSKRVLAPIQSKQQIGLSMKFDDKVRMFEQKSDENMMSKGFNLMGTGARFLKSNVNKPTGVGDTVTENQEQNANVKGILRDSLFNEVKRLDTKELKEVDGDDRKSVRFNLNNERDGDPEEKNSLKSPTASGSDPFNNEEDEEADSWNLSDEQQPEHNMSTKNPFSEIKQINISQKNQQIKTSPFGMFSGVKSLYDENKIDTAIKTPNQLASVVDDKRLDNVIQQKRSKENVDEVLREIEQENENYLYGAIADAKEKYFNLLLEKQKELDDKYQMDLKDLSRQYDDKLIAFRSELELNHKKDIEMIRSSCNMELEKAKHVIKEEHRAAVDLLQKNHSEILHDLERDLKLEQELLKKDNVKSLAEMKEKLNQNIEIERRKKRDDERQYEKIRCEKRLLEEKYKTLKEKYVRLKTEVKQSLERRNRRKEQLSMTTGSETERSNSNKHSQENTESQQKYFDDFSNSFEYNPQSISKPKDNEPIKVNENIKRIQQVFCDDTSISQTDTTVSTQNYSKPRPKTANHGNVNNESAMQRTNALAIQKNTPKQQRKKVFNRAKSASTSHLHLKKRDEYGRACTPVESIRTQLQKLEDLEDQFPDVNLDTTYHLRYPFSDAVKETSAQNSSSELEFFKHRIHLERDSVRRAKESLKMQKINFRARQQDIKNHQKNVSRHTLDQLIHEQKELSDMEVSLHRTRALLGEKVIRLRHLEQSLQKICAKERQIDSFSDTNRDDTLSELSSHSSSGFSSIDVVSDGHVLNRGKSDQTTKESSEIIQSLENLNAEIREIWSILSKQQQLAIPPPPLVQEISTSSKLSAHAMIQEQQSNMNSPDIQHIPTLADRLETYRLMAMGKKPVTGTHNIIGAVGGGVGTMVTQSPLATSYTTTLVEKTRDLRNWLRQAKTEQELLNKTGGKQSDL